jgi:glycosyltransferase involved in cell wall biosynthesis
MTLVFQNRYVVCHESVTSRLDHSHMSQHDFTNFRVDILSPGRKSMRIAVVTETYPPEVNGVALTLARLVEGLRAANHEIQLIRLRQGAADAVEPELLQSGFHEVLMRGLPVPRYPGLRMGVPSKGALIRLWQLRRPDVIHIATEGPLGWSALRAASYLKLPVSTDYRTNFQSYSAHYGVGFLHKPIMAYLRKFHNRADCTMVPTEALRLSLASAGFHKLKVVSRGVDTTTFDPAHRSAWLRTQWGLAPQDLAVLFVGRLAAEKNLDLLVRAFDAIRQLDPSARLVLVGHGPMRQALQAQCPNAVFTGQLRGISLAQHYASADLFLMPSVTETFGNVTTEAMASGLPVVAFRHAAAAELMVDGVNGRLAPLGDEAGFVSAARELASHPLRRTVIGAAARQTVLPLDWVRIVRMFESVLQDVIDTSSLRIATEVHASAVSPP